MAILYLQEDFLIELIEIATGAGTQQALDSGGWLLNTGIELSVWKVSQGIPAGSLTQYLSDSE